MKIKCPNCGQINTEEQLDYIDKENELGEDFCKYTLDCAGCKAVLYEGSEWGHWDRIEKEEIYEEIKEHFMKDLSPAEKVYETFWKDIVENEDGSINKEQLIKEMADYKMIMSEVSHVYDELAGFSKPHTRAQVIIDEVNERMIDKQMAFDDLMQHRKQGGEVVIPATVLANYFDVKSIDHTQILSANDFRLWAVMNQPEGLLVEFLKSGDTKVTILTEDYHFHLHLPQDELLKVCREERISNFYEDNHKV